MSMSPLLREHLQKPRPEQWKREASVKCTVMPTPDGKTYTYEWRGPEDGLLPVSHELEADGFPDTTPDFPWKLEKVGENPDPDAKTSYYRRAAV